MKNFNNHLKRNGTSMSVVKVPAVEMPDQVRGGRDSYQNVIVMDDDPSDDSPVSLDITRETNNINQKLPFCLWAPVNIPESYFTVFQQCQILPTGGPALTVTFDTGTRGDVLFTWTIGGNTDILRIHNAGLVPYATQLQMILTTGKFYTSGIRYDVDESDVAFINAQFRSYNFYYGSSTFEGVSVAGSKRVKAMKGPNQFQNGIIDFAKNMLVENNIFHVHGFGNRPLTPAVARTISFDYFDVAYGTLATS